jgi:hypothetical protein
MIPNFDAATQFMHRCAMDGDKSSEAVLKGVVGLMGDMGSTFSHRMAPLFADATMIALVQHSSQIEDFQDVASYTQKVTTCFLRCKCMGCSCTVNTHHIFLFGVQLLQVMAAVASSKR